MSLIYNGNVTDTVIYNGQPTTGVYNGVIVWGESGPASHGDSYIIQITPSSPSDGQNFNIEQLDVNGTGISSSNTYKLEKKINGVWVDDQSNLQNLWSGAPVYFGGTIDALRIYFWSSSLQSGDIIRLQIPSWDLSKKITTEAIEYDSVNQTEGSIIQQQTTILANGYPTSILTMP